MPKQHTMDCDFPEGCSCGASDYNRLERERDEAVAFATRLERGDLRFGKLCDEQLLKISRLELDKGINESLSEAVARVLKEKNALKYGLTHPTIDCEYYDWLNEIGRMQKLNPGDFESGFWKKYCPDFQNFHAIAMWVWQKSRTRLRAKVEAKISKEVAPI